MTARRGLWGPDLPLSTRLRATARAALAGLACLLATALLPGAAPFAADEERPACGDCHEIDTGSFAGSAHGGMECTDCHSGSEVVPHEDLPTAPGCADCHDEISGQYAESAHGVAWKKGQHEAAACADCHGDFHAIVPSSDPASPVSPASLAATCGRCHADPDLVARHGIPIARPMEAYEASVHARAISDGAPGATCSACHGSHELFKASDPRSSVNHLKVAETCGQCHAEVAAAYATSVHGTAAAHGMREAPVCTDCHGEHRILSPSEPGSPVYATNIPRMTCGRCHGDLRLADKYGIKAGQVSSYEDSYHGLASRSGKLTVAHCGSCHGVHGILPSSNPDSPINEEHLAETCGRCHPGAGSVFPIGKVHVDEGDSEHAVIDWVRNLYVLLIFVTIGGMLLHNVLDLYRKTRAPRPAALTVGGPLRLRMLPGFRAAHILMMMSFAVLAWTGFALTYPEAWWARPLLLWEESFSLRGWLHRGAAVVMILSIAVHLAHLMTSRAARKCIAKMRPSLHDVTELRERILWFVGRRADPPPAPELGYPEKMEYIALMWGVLVMAVTGGALWFENVVLRWLPKWTADLATVIHFYEGVLASLAILVWHFYFVIFDPVVYPMDAAWLTGRSHPGRVLERRASEVRSRPPHLPEPMPSGDPPLPEDGAAPQPPGRPPGPSPHST